MIRVVALGVVALALAGCATMNKTAVNCAQQQAQMTAIEQSLPVLEAAAETALQQSGGNKAAAQVKDAQAALAIAEASLAAAQAYMSASCAAKTG